MRDIQIIMLCRIFAAFFFQVNLHDYIVRINKDNNENFVLIQIIFFVQFF